jgi:hypothetical protein
MVQAADEVYSAAAMLPANRRAEAVLAAYYTGPQPAAPIGDAEQVKVFVNDGRWLVQCPHCNSAQLAARSDPRFFCIECQNNGTMLWAQVVWPADPTGIETELSARPHAVNQQWLPSETVADLVAENAANGVVAAG